MYRCDSFQHQIESAEHIRLLAHNVTNVIKHAMSHNRMITAKSISSTWQKGSKDYSYWREAERMVVDYLCTYKDEF